MDDFQPRIEDPPPPNRSRVDGRFAKLREFVIAAAGQWCFVAQLDPKPGETVVAHIDRKRFRSSLYHAITRMPGYEHSGIEMRTVQDGPTFKVYARYEASKAVKFKGR